MITNDSIKAASKKLAAQRKISEEEFDLRLDKIRELLPKHTPNCLTYAEWECWFEGTLSTDRLDHISCCDYCSANIKEREAPGTSTKG